MEKVIRFEDVKNQTTEEYFEKNQFSIDAFYKKYSLNNETYVEAIKRVCDFVASVEKTDELKKYWSERWFDEIYNDWWHPAGSIMQGAGSGKKISLSNCVTLSLGTKRDKEEWDNLESIIRNTAYTVAKSAAYRQGLGVDFSRLRPVGTKVMNSANESTGAVHWMKFIDSIGYYVGQSGRIPAFLFSISINHPDVVEFIGVKKDYTKIQNANISVQVTNDFYKQVEKDGDWEMKFTIPGVKAGDRVYFDRESATSDCQLEKETNRWYKIATIDRKREEVIKTEKARTLLRLIAKNMHSNAEPGIQNIDIISKYSNSDVFYDPDDIDGFDSRVVSSNACSEQMLDRNGTCILSSINCEKFSLRPEEYVNELQKIGQSINRFLDNVVECELRFNTYTTPYQKMSMERLRRTGAGFTNISAWLFKAGLEYGSEAGNEAIEEFTKLYVYWMYYFSEKLGKEKGDFGVFDSEKWKSANFVKRLYKESFKLNKKYGVPVLEGENMRNVTCISIAPTGSLALMFRGLVLSYGIEPAFFMYFWKRTRISGKYEYYFCVPRVVRDMFRKEGLEIPIDSDTIKDTWDGKRGKEVAEYIDSHRNKFKFLESVDISPMTKLDLMSKVMKWVDSSISVTYMLPEGSTCDDVYNFILEAYKKELKSIAAFPDRKMYGIVSKLPFYELATKLQDEGVLLHPQNFSDDELKKLNLSTEIITTDATQSPKRLKTLDACIHTVTVKGEKFVIVVGLQNGQPYEIFGGHLNGLGIKSGYKEGKIHKVKGGQYSLEFDDIFIEDFSKQFTPTEQILFRMTSMGLRHGIPINVLVEQLQKATEDITSMAAAAARVLKKYIKDGTELKGKKCPTCGGSLLYLDGCVSCASGCGWSKCG